MKPEQRMTTRKIQIKEKSSYMREPKTCLCSLQKRNLQVYMISALNRQNMGNEQLKHSMPKIKTTGHTSILSKKNLTLPLAKIVLKRTSRKPA